MVALHIPLGEESGFRGFVDLVKMKAVTFAGGKPTEGEIPGEAGDRAKEYREKLVEAAAKPTTTCSPSTWRKAPSAKPRC
jgi:elongation factor G